MTKHQKQLVEWKASKTIDGIVKEWKLLVWRGTRRKNAATVWLNDDGRATWHTWDRDGVGGDNDVEETVESAKIEAAASAIAQGFI